MRSENDGGHEERSYEDCDRRKERSDEVEFAPSLLVACSARRFAPLHCELPCACIAAAKSTTFSTVLNAFLYATNSLVTAAPRASSLRRGG